MMASYSCQDLLRKLKRERVEACLNCKRFVVCNEIGENVECDHFEETDNVWEIRQIR